MAKLRTRQPEQLMDDTMAVARQRLNAVLLKDNPVEYAQQTLGVYLWSKQREIIEALETHNRVAVRSCHDSGKSFTAAVIVARWLDVHPMGQARVITTAPTATQVRGILWVEINQLHERANLPGRINQTEWWMGSYLAGIGRKPADYRPEAFSGLHARWPLIVIDEAGGVSASLIDAAETLATNINAKILMIGNPDDPQSLFAEIHGDPEKHGYHTIKISAWDTPNFTEEGPALLADSNPAANLLPEVLLSPAWVEGRRKAWGEDHPFWVSKVEAEFPSQDSMSIVRIVDLIKARIPLLERVMSFANAGGGYVDVEVDGVVPGIVDEERGASAHEWRVGGSDGPPSHLPPTRPIVTQTPNVGGRLLHGVGAPNWPPTLGVDVAGSETGDETVIRLVQTPPVGLPLAVGNAQDSHTRLALQPTTEWRARSSDPSIVADTIVNAASQSGAKRINIDSIGVGFGIVGLVRERLAARNHKAKVIGVNASAKANDPTLYGNLRAELWWTIGRLYFQRGLIDMSVADNAEELEAQLLMPRYKIVKGRIFVEAKADIKQRLGRSPDQADAFMYGMWHDFGGGVATLSRPPQIAIDSRSPARGNLATGAGPIGMGRLGGKMISTGSVNTKRERFGVGGGVR